MADKKFEIGDAVRFGWETAKANIGFFVVMVLVIWVVQGIFNWPSYVRLDPYYVWMPIFSVLNWIVSTFIRMAIIRISLRFNKGETAEMRGPVDGLSQVPGILRGLASLRAAGDGGVHPADQSPASTGRSSTSSTDTASWTGTWAPSKPLKTSGEMTRGSWWNVFWLGLLSAAHRHGRRLRLLRGAVLGHPHRPGGARLRLHEAGLCGTPGGDAGTGRGRACRSGASARSAPGIRVTQGQKEGGTPALHFFGKSCRRGQAGLAASTSRRNISTWARPSASSGWLARYASVSA